MQLFKTPAAFLAAITLATSTTVFAQNDFATGLLAALRQNGLNQLATIVEQNAAQLVPVLQTQGDKTVLAPTDAAFQQLGDDAPTGAELVRVISYHVLTSQVDVDDIPRDGYDHQIAATLLNSTNLPSRKQVVVLARGSNNTMGDDDGDDNNDDNNDDDDDGRPIVVQLQNNVSFANNSDGPRYQSILVQPITSVLSIPQNLTQVVQALGANQIAQLLTSANLVQPLEQLPAVTIFAPSNAAIQAANAQIQAASPADQLNVLRNHVLNGTVAYSTNLPSDDDDDDDNNNNSGNVTRQATTASGQQLTFSNRDDGLFVTSGNVTARIIRSDVLLGNGVVHVIDNVLLNTQLNQQAANSAASSASSVAATNTAAPGTGGGGSSDSGNPQNGAQSILISMTVLASAMVASGLFLLA